jgi:hypothetical protein
MKFRSQQACLLEQHAVSLICRSGTPVYCPAATTRRAHMEVTCYVCCSSRVRDRVAFTGRHLANELTMGISTRSRCLSLYHPPAYSTTSQLHLYIRISQKLHKKYHPPGHLPET